MRGEYLSLLMCALFAWAAAYLPVAAVVWIAGPYTPWLFLAANVYFLGLTALSVRTLTGGQLGPSAGAVAVGCVAAMAGLVAYEFAGSMRGYLMSPFFLYYAYALFLSDVRALGDGLRARQHLRRQLEIATSNPRDADAHYQLGLIYQKRRQYSEAIPRFERAIEIDPTEGDAHLQLGRIALDQGRAQDAIRHFKNAASIDEKLSSNEVWRDLGAAYFAAGNAEAAANALEKYADRRPYDPEGLCRLGQTLAALGHNQSARERFEQCIEAVKTAPPHRRVHVRNWGGEARSALRALK
jgi:tetratricopeptide (TPR) repeat protein